VGAAVDHVALKRPLDIVWVFVVGHKDRVLALAVAALEADLLGRGVAVGEVEAVEVGVARRLVAGADAAGAVAAVGRGEGDAAGVAGGGVGAIVVVDLIA
jgi:hypothetical protein